MKLHGLRQMGQHRSLLFGSLTFVAIGFVTPAIAAPADKTTNPIPVSNICTFEAASQWRASMDQIIKSQNTNSDKARESLFGFYIPEIAKVIQQMPAAEREQLADNILVWMNPENFEKGLDLKARSAEALSPEEIYELISFETCWQSLLTYVLTINPEYREDFDILSQPNYFNEPLDQVGMVDKSRYLVFLVNGTIKLSEILRSAKVLTTLAEKQGAQICAQLPSDNNYQQMVEPNSDPNVEPIKVQKVGN